MLNLPNYIFFLFQPPPPPNGGDTRIDVPAPIDNYLFLGLIIGVIIAINYFSREKFNFKNLLKRIFFMTHT
jgi:hypothetical protein